MVLRKGNKKGLNTNKTIRNAKTNKITIVQKINDEWLFELFIYPFNLSVSKKVSDSLRVNCQITAKARYIKLNIEF